MICLDCLGPDKVFVTIVLAAGGIALLVTLLFAQSKEGLRWWGEKVDKLIAWMVDKWPGKD